MQFQCKAGRNRFAKGTPLGPLVSQDRAVFFKSENSSKCTYGSEKIVQRKIVVLVKDPSKMPASFFCLKAKGRTRTGPSSCFEYNT